MRRRLVVTLRWLAICGLYVLWALALTASWLLAQTREAALWLAAQARAAIDAVRADMSEHRRIDPWRVMYVALLAASAAITITVIRWIFF